MVKCARDRLCPSRVTGQFEVELDRGARWKAQVSWFRDSNRADPDTPREGATPRDVHWFLSVVIATSKARAAAAEGVQMADRDIGARLAPGSRRASPKRHPHGARWRAGWLLSLLLALTVPFGVRQGAGSNCPSRVTGQFEVTLDRGARWKAQVSWFRDIIRADPDTPREAGFVIELDVLW